MGLLSFEQMLEIPLDSLEEILKDERDEAIVTVKEACERARTAHVQISRKTCKSRMKRHDHEVLDLLSIADNAITEALSEWNCICKMHRAITRKRGESKKAKIEEKS